MRIFRTPPKNWLTIAFLVVTILGSPVVVAAHFFIRDFHGDYGIEDSIMIPIAGYFIEVFPFALIFLILGLRRYTPDRFIFTWNRHRFWRSLGWTILLLTPLAWTYFMIFDGINGRLYWVAAFFMFYFYGLLVLRAWLVSCDPKLLPQSPEPAAADAAPSPE